MFTLLLRQPHTMREITGLGVFCMEVIMFNISTVDLVATGKNIEKLRKEAGLSVKELQNAVCRMLFRDL